MSTTAQEVESIVVRLTGDGSQYNRMMTQAQATTKTTGSVIHGMARDVDGFGQTLSRFGEAAVAGYGLNKLKGMLHQAFDAFSESELIGLRLTATLEANGREVDALTSQYTRFAEEMEKLTTHEDDAVLSMLRMAETFDVTGTAAQKAVQDAIGLAAITGTQAESLIRLTAALAKGDTEQAMRFARMVPQLRGIKDQNEFLAKAEQLVASGMKAANAEMQSASGILKMLHRDYGNMLEDVGKIIAEGIKPLADGLRNVIASIRALDDQTKRFLTIVLLVSTALLSVGPQIALFRAIGLPALRMMADGFQILWYLVTLIVKPLTVLAAIWSGIATIGATVFSGVGVAIAIAALAISVFVSRMGGIKPIMYAVVKWASETWTRVSTFALQVWGTIKGYVNTFLVWFAPIWKAIGQLGVTVWNLIVKAASVAWDYIVMAAEATWAFLGTVWRSIFGDAKINWTYIRDTIADAIMFAEFTLLNLKQVSEYVWAAIKLGAVMMANFVANNVFRILIAGMTGGLSELNINWQETFKAMWTFAKNVFKSLVDNISGDWLLLTRVLMGDPTVWFEIGARAWSSFGQGMTVTSRGFRLPQLEALERQLREEFNRLGTALGMDFARFRAQRLAELGVSPEEIRAAEKAGSEIGGAINRGMGDPLKKLEGTIFGSMEAYARLLDYRERVLQPGNRPTPSLAGESAEAVSPILRRIAMATERMAGRPPVVVEGAGL